MKIETLVDYTVQYTKENGKPSQRRFRLESALQHFLSTTPSAFRVDKTEVTMTWLHVDDTAPKAADGFLPV